MKLETPHSQCWLLMERGLCARIAAHCRDVYIARRHRSRTFQSQSSQCSGQEITNAREGITSAGQCLISGIENYGIIGNMREVALIASCIATRRKPTVFGGRA
jgi:hypothetical protein